MDLSDEAGLCKRGVEDVIDIDRKKLQEALFAGSGHGVCSVIGIRPCVCAIGEAAVRKMIYNALVWVFLRTHEYEAWVAVQNLCGCDAGETYCSRVCGQPLSLKT